MSLEAARELSVLDLARLLAEKLDLECTGIRVSRPLESEIAGLEARAREVLWLISSLRNTLRPVNKLPPEILSQIFQHILCHRGSEGSFDEYINQDSQSLIPLTHVCRYWRESIVSNPKNWTLVSSRSKKLAALSLERSKAAPLVIRLAMDAVKRQPGFPDVIAPYIQNTATLEFYELDSTEDLMQILPNFPQTMPNLKSLCLQLSIPATPNHLGPSVDPFQPFPSTLEDLLLIDTPLYPSFLNLRNLTNFSYHAHGLNCPLDHLLDILAENRRLRNMLLQIEVRGHGHAAHRLPHWAPINNELKQLTVVCDNLKIIKALLDCIPLRRGAELCVVAWNPEVGLDNIFSSIPATHFANLLTPTHMESRGITFRLSGANGKFTFRGASASSVSFAKLSFFSLNNVQELHIGFPAEERCMPTSRVFEPSPFPALQTLAIESDSNVSKTLSPLFSSPGSCPSLKTLAFLDCNPSDGFMMALEGFASSRQSTASTWLNRVLIVQSDGIFPSPDSIRRLREFVTIVDAWTAGTLPTDLTPGLEKGGLAG